MSNNANTPTLKQKMFAKKYIEYKGNASKAALEVYDTKPELSQQVGHITLKQEGTQRAIEEILAKNQIDLETLSAYGSEALQNNLTLGKPSQAVGADLLKFYYKLYNVIPSNPKVVMKQERKEIYSKDYKTIKEELTTTVSASQELLNDIS